MTLLKVKEAALRLNLSPSKVYELVERGEISHFRLSGAIRISESHLAEFLDANEHGRGENATVWPAQSRPIKLKHLK